MWDRGKETREERMGVSLKDWMKERMRTGESHVVMVFSALLYDLVVVW